MFDYLKWQTAKQKSPEAEFTRECIKNSQRFVNGEVRVQLYKGHARVVGRSSTTSLYRYENILAFNHNFNRFNQPL